MSVKVSYCKTMLSISTVPLLSAMVRELIFVVDDWVENVESHPPERIRFLAELRRRSSS